MIDDLWYKNGLFYCLAIGTYMDANGDGIGDFKGLLRRLDYLHGLGITAIWLMPFQPSPGKDDGYDISDYYGHEFCRLSGPNTNSVVLRMRVRGRRKRHADPLLLNPDHRAVAGRGVAHHHQAKSRRHEGGIVDVDRSTLWRDVPHHAMHHRARRRNVGRLVDLGSLMLSFLFHGVWLQAGIGQVPESAKSKAIAKT
jgi:hypothetical protein